MSVKVPIRTVFDGSNNATGLSEYQSGEFIGLTHGGLGASLSIGTTGQVLKVNSGGTALEFGNVEAVVNIDGATDLTGSTLVAGDQILISDGGTEGRATLSQIDTLFSGTTQTLTNKSLTSPTITGTGAIAGTFTGNITGDVTGNADTATTLETARTIAGQSFDGSSNITIASTDLSNTSDVVLLNSTQTLTNKNLTSPTITGTGAIAGTFTGNITGDVTGNADTATTLETARTIGGVSFDGSANINLPGVNTSGNQDTSGNADTATTLETARTIAGQSFDGSANITIAATDLSDTNQSLSTSDNVTFADLTLSGDLTVNGTTTTVASTNTTITDNLIELNSGAASNANDTGILIERGSTGDNAIIAWDESADKFTVGTTTATADSTGNLTITTGTLVANVEGNVTGDVTGNADTATTLETARTIGGVSFDGSANINLPGVNTAGNQDTSGNAATATTLETARTIGGTSFDGSANIAVNLAATATALATARTIHGVSFDGTANIDLTEVVQDTVGAMFSSNTESGITVTYQDGDGTIDLTVGTLNQNTTGSAATLTTPRAFSLTGDVTASGVNFDGSGAVALSTSIAANTVGISELNVTDGSSGQFLQTNGSGTLTFATVTTPTLASLNLDTDDDVQFDSFGVGTAASGTTGEIRATNDVTAFYSSDVALKEDIVNISNPLDAVEKLNGVLFNWKQSYIDQRGGEDGYFVRRKDVGVIAQDVEKVLPEAVATRSDGVKAVKYDRLTCLLIEAVKALKLEIEELKK